MPGGSGCRSESWLAVRLRLKLKLEWELESELELKLQPERELELELRPLKLDKYGGHPKNPDLGPKLHYLANC